MNTIRKMTTVIRSTEDDVIRIPAGLMQELGLREGVLVQATIENGALRIKRVESFLALRGQFANDEAFEKAFGEITGFITTDSAPLSVHR